MIEDIKISSLLEPVFKNIVQSNTNIDTIFFITESNLNRVYPQIDVPDLIDRGKLPSSMVCHDYPFFYTVDPINNPEKKIKWTETYYDVTDKGWMVTCLAPIYLSNNVFKGVVGIDITIEKLKQNIIDKSLEDTQSNIILLNEKGNNVILSDKKERIELVDLLKSGRDYFSRMIQGKTGYEIINIDDKENAIIYTPISSTNWSLALVLPIKIITSDIELKINNQIESMKKIILSKIIWSGALIALIVTLLSLYLSKKITNPILSIVDSCLAFSRGDLDKRVNIGNNDEIGVLARSFNSMAEKLNNTIGHLNELNKNLESIVQKRTIELQKSNDHLKTVNEKLRQAESARRLFFINMSHDLKTPLTAIQGYVEILLGGNYSGRDQLENYLSIIYNVASHVIWRDIFYCQ